MKKKRKGRLTAPRQDIPWFPRIDAELCNSCLSCYDFCPKDVFASAKSEEGLRGAERGFRTVCGVL
ncbi:MAG: 4Fe-4S binding protein [Prosthecochloris sp.]|nr:4Fe-4S binding protein [Prosthecochloris sp.]